MRIALVSQEYPPETAKGGIGTQTYLKAHGFAELGHQVYVISRSTDAHRHERQDNEVRVTRIPSTHTPVYTDVADWINYSVAVSEELARQHEQTPFDIVDFPEWACEGYAHLLNQSEWNRIPTVVHLHGPLVMLAHTIGWPEMDTEFYRVGTHMEATCLRLADAIFTSSGCSADWCAMEYGLARTDIPRLHTGIDTSLFHPLDVQKESRPTIVFVGKLVRNKGVELLLEAACALVREYPDLQLRMLGAGEQDTITRLRARADEAGLGDLLDLSGPVHRKDLPEHLSRAHIFAAPSQYEGGPGFVYLEAMACGLPVIACRGSGAAEVVHEGENGLLVDPEDVDSLTIALRKLLSDTSLRQEMGQRGRQFVIREADSRHCVGNIAKFYEQVREKVANGQRTD